MLADGRAAATATVADVRHDPAADDGVGRVINGWLCTVSSLQSGGTPIPRGSPCQLLGTEPGKQCIREVLERYVDFDEIPGCCERTATELVVGTVTVDSGEFETFVNEAVTVEAFVAELSAPSGWRHDALDGNADAHLRSSVLGRDVFVPVRDGALAARGTARPAGCSDSAPPDGCSSRRRFGA